MKKNRRNAWVGHGGKDRLKIKPETKETYFAKTNLNKDLQKYNRPKLERYILFRTNSSWVYIIVKFSNKNYSVWILFKIVF